MVLLTIAALIGGIAYGVLAFDFSLVTFLTSHTDLVLYILMFCVGISIGTQKGVLQRLRQNQLAIVLVPTGVIVASLLGGVICGWITRMPLSHSTAITSGMGWYSLAGAVIGESCGPELGSIAFLSNLMREIFTFMIIPFLAAHFNPYACIASAGATSEDTTLPMILRYSNEETVVVSVLNGIICSFFVPILLSLCFRLP